MSCITNITLLILQEILQVPFLMTRNLETQAGLPTVAYAGFRKGGVQKFQKIWEEKRSESENVPLKFSLIFRPKLGEEQKKGLHSNLVRFCAQN